MRGLVAVASIIAACVALSGCASKPKPYVAPNPPASTMATQAADQSPAPAPTSTSPFATSGSMSLKDKQGYTATLTFSSESQNGFLPDVSKAAPGYTDFAIATSESVSLENTTPGRDEPVHLVVQFEAAYAMSSGLCSDKYPVENTVVGTNASVATSPSGTKYCLISTAPQHATLDPVPAGATVDIPAYSGSGNTISNVPESANMQPVLNAPAATAVLVGDDGNWEPTEPHCAVQIANVYDQVSVSYFALSAQAGVLCQ